MLRAVRRRFGSGHHSQALTGEGADSSAADASEVPLPLQDATPRNSRLSRASSSLARRFHLCGSGSRQQHQEEQVQAMLQHEEGIRDDDEVEALGASVEHVGQTIESTKVKYQWVFRIAGVDHVVEFFNSKLSGRKKLLMDSKLIYTQQQLRVSGFEYSWPCSGHLLSVIYDLHAQTFALTINGSDLENQRPHAASYSPSPPSSPVAPSAHQRYEHQQQRYQYEQPYQQQHPQHQQLRGAAHPMAAPGYAHQAHQPQQQQHQQHEGPGSSSGYRIRVSPPASSTQARDDADLLDLVSSTGCPSSPCCISNSAAPSGTNGPSLEPRVAGSGRASSADDELAQLDSTFWSEPPHTPDFPAPVGPPEGPPEAPLQLPASASPSSQGPYCQGSPASMPVQNREQDDTRSGTGGTGGSPARAPSKPKGEPLFADLMELASDKLNISLSPRTRLGGPRS